MARRERVRARPSAGPEPGEGDLWPERLPRRPLADTRSAAQLLERIRQLLHEQRGAARD